MSRTRVAVLERHEPRPVPSEPDPFAGPEVVVGFPRVESEPVERVRPVDDHAACGELWLAGVRG